jgi:hypothetical protein
VFLAELSGQWFVSPPDGDMEAYLPDRPANFDRPIN